MLMAARSTQTASGYLANLFGLSGSQLDRVLALAVGSQKKGAYCDIYFQVGKSESLVLDLEQLRKPTRKDISGAGIRVVIGEKTGFSYTDHVNFRNLCNAAKSASTIALYAEETATLPIISDQVIRDLYTLDSSLIAIPLGSKIDFMERIDRLVRQFDSRIKNCTVRLETREDTIIIATSLGDLVLDKRPLVKLTVSCLAEDGKQKASDASSCGGRVDFDYFLQEDRWKICAQTTAKQVIAKLSALPAPAGEMTVVLGQGWPGVLIHEAVGHGLEGDFNRKGTSAFSKMVGQKVASDLCTIVDNGTLPGRRGSLNVDDEGVSSSTTVLIEKGILKGYLQDRVNGNLMQCRSTGNGRRQSYRHIPMPRMTNTYLESGKSDPEEIIRSVKRGIFVVSVSGGAVDITSGDFSFSATSAFQIENGKLTEAVKGATLIGNGPKTLHQVIMVGNDLALDEGTGTCGKRGQSVPIGVGMPTVRIDGVTVGGTARLYSRQGNM